MASVELSHDELCFLSASASTIAGGGDMLNALLAMREARQWLERLGIDGYNKLINRLCTTHDSVCIKCGKVEALVDVADADFPLDPTRN